MASEMQIAATRGESALKAARALVDALEIEDAPAERCLMLAQRLARLLRDQDAQIWLDFEQRGYPAELDKKRLGSCSKYAPRFKGDTVVLRESLPALEAEKAASKTVLEKLNAPSITKPAENHLAAQATQSVVMLMVRTIGVARDAYVTVSTRYSKMRATLHRWACDTLIALELGSAAENIFDLARSDADRFVRAHIPDAAEKLLAVNDRMHEGTPEALSSALASCRRVIASVADALFPARQEPYVDSRGKTRVVGQEQYKNRLLAFMEATTASTSTNAIVDSHLEHLAARLDAIYEKACKGVHDTVTADEARLLVIQTYLFIAEVARRATLATWRIGPAAEVEAALGGTASPPPATA